MKKCKRCETYNVVLVADKSQPSEKCMIAPQSDSEAEHWASIPRWIYAYPLEETDHCYYCTKVLNGQIGTPSSYGIAYDAKQEARWEARQSA